MESVYIRQRKVESFINSYCVIEHVRKFQPTPQRSILDSINKLDCVTKHCCSYKVNQAKKMNNFEDTKGVITNHKSATTMNKWKWTKIKHNYTKYYTENHSLSNLNFTNTQRWTHVHRKGKYFLLQFAALVFLFKESLDDNHRVYWCEICIGSTYFVIFCHWSWCHITFVKNQVIRNKQR